MKKLLALVLALVMTLSLCVVSSNAAYTGEDFDYEEAVEVMSAVGVFQGDETGKFNPTGILTREQAAQKAFNTEKIGTVKLVTFSQLTGAMQASCKL